MLPGMGFLHLNGLRQQDVLPRCRISRSEDPGVVRFQSAEPRGLRVAQQASCPGSGHFAEDSPQACVCVCD